MPDTDGLAPSPATQYLPAFDGSGNVTGMLKKADGTVMAKYEYDPFGQLLRAEGDYAKSNPFRFSTKFTDDESGLVYYGFRYYAPSLGRFVNRDPIEERGGVNLYSFVGNDSVNRWDYLGQDGESEEKYPVPDSGMDPDWWYRLTLPTFPVTGSQIGTGDEWKITFEPFEISEHKITPISQMVFILPASPIELEFHVIWRGSSTSGKGASLGSKGTNYGDKFRKCFDLAQTISSLEGKTQATIADFSSLRTYFDNANTANNLSAGEKALLGGITLTTLIVGLIENAGVTALAVLPAENGSLPVIVSGGRLIGVGNPALRSTVQAAVAARNVGAALEGAKSFAPKAGIFAGEHSGMQRFFDPGGAYAEESLERGDALSSQQSKTVKDMQDALRALKEKYKNECGQ